MGPRFPAPSSWCPSLQALQCKGNSCATQHKPRELAKPWGAHSDPQMLALGPSEFPAWLYTTEHSPSSALVACQAPEKHAGICPLQGRQTALVLAFPHPFYRSPGLLLRLKFQNFSLTSAPGGTLSHPALRGQGPTSPSSQHLLTGFGWVGIRCIGQLLQFRAVEFLSDGVKQFVQGHFHRVLQVSGMHNLYRDKQTSSRMVSSWAGGAAEFESLI